MRLAAVAPDGSTKLPVSIAARWRSTFCMKPLARRITCGTPEARKTCSTCAALRAKNEIGAAISAPSTDSLMMPPTAARCAAAMSALSHAT
jgi:hypothetical protein